MEFQNSKTAGMLLHSKHGFKKAMTDAGFNLNTLAGHTIEDYANAFMGMLAMAIIDDGMAHDLPKKKKDAVKLVEDISMLPFEE